MKTFSVNAGIRRAGLLALLLAALGLLPGCAMFKMTYNQADHIAAWMADDYFELQSPQKEMFHARFQRFHSWHRREQLPEYIGLLRSARTRAENGLTREDLQWVNETLDARFRLLIDQSVGDMAEMLATIDEDQLQAMHKRFAKVNRKFAKEHELGSPPEDQRRKRAKDFIDRLEHWTGPVSSEQKQKIATLQASVPLVDELRAADRVRRQKEFAALLALRKNSAEFTPKLRRWLQHWEQGRSPEYEKKLAEVKEKNAEFYLAVDKLMTREQRAHVVQRLQDYIEDLQSLSQQKTRSAKSD